MQKRFQKNSAAYLDFYRHNRSCFGGALLKGNPKRRRPLTHLQALHVVLRSSLARGPRSMLQKDHRQQIQKIIFKQAKTFDVQLFRFANSGNHLHLLLRPPKERKKFVAFMRAISGLIARKILRAEKMRPKKQKFWDYRPFSRVVQWGMAFLRCALYVEKNTLETQGTAALQRLRQALARWRSTAPPNR